VDRRFTAFAGKGGNLFLCGVITMKQCMRMSWLALAALACAGLLWPAATQAIQKEKDKVYEVGGGDGLKIDGKLAADDKKDKEWKDSYCKVYLVKLTGGKKIHHSHERGGPEGDR